MTRKKHHQASIPLHLIREHSAKNKKETQCLFFVLKNFLKWTAKKSNRRCNRASSMDELVRFHPLNRPNYSSVLDPMLVVAVHSRKLSGRFLYGLTDTLYIKTGDITTYCPCRGGICVRIVHREMLHQSHLLPFIVA